MVCTRQFMILKSLNLSFIEKSNVLSFVQSGSTVHVSQNQAENPIGICGLSGKKQTYWITTDKHSWLQWYSLASLTNKPLSHYDQSHWQHNIILALHSLAIQPATCITVWTHFFTLHVLGYVFIAMPIWGWLQG